MTNKNFETNNGDIYLKIKGKKTKTYTSVKLPEYAIAIYKKYKPRSNRNMIFTPITLFNFNKTLKSIARKAGFTASIEISRKHLRKVLKSSKTAQNECTLL